MCLAFYKLVSAKPMNSELGSWAKVLIAWIYTNARFNPKKCFDWLFYLTFTNTAVPPHMSGSQAQSYSWFFF